jgi:hypothetical protein
MHQQSAPTAQPMHTAHSSPNIVHQQQSYPVPNPMPSQNITTNYDSMVSNGFPNSVYDVFTIPQSSFY